MKPIWIVDDDQSIRFVLEKALAREDLAVRSFTNPRDVLAALEVGDAQITLRTRIARQVTLGKQRYRLALDLHIQDNGPGVPESIRERIFYPLVSGRDGGSGLGQIGRAHV